MLQKNKVFLYQIISLFILSTIRFSAIAQTEESDTIYIQAAPLVIKQTYYLPHNSKRNNQSPWFVAAGIGLGNNFSNLINSDTISVDKKSFTNPSLSIGQQIGNWSVSIGLSYLTTTLSSQNHTHNRTNRERTYTVIDTLDIYYQTTNGVTSTYYVTEDRTVTETYTVSKDSSYSFSRRVNYIQIPIIVGYKLGKNKWYVNPSIGIIPSFSLSTTPLIENSASSKPNQFVWMASANLALGRSITSHISAEVYAETIKSFSPISNDSRTGSIFLGLAGFKLRYFL